jgi:hypothetical protein
MENGMARNPDKKHYHSPSEVLNDPQLLDSEKKKILQAWENDEKALLRADDENMARQDGDEPRAPAALLASIQKAERKLECGDTQGN